MTNVSANSRVAIRAESLIAAHYLGQILKSRSARVRSDWRKRVEGEWDEWKNCAARVAARRPGDGGFRRVPGLGGDGARLGPRDHAGRNHRQRLASDHQ